MNRAIWQWNISTAGERFGSSINFEYKPTSDSLSVMEVQAATRDPLDKTLTNGSANSTCCSLPTDGGAAEPVADNAKVPKDMIRCCCASIEIDTVGDSKGNYNKEPHRRLGAVVTCHNLDWEVAFYFEVELHIYYIKASPLDCTWGQDAKGDRVFQFGKCTHHDSVFVADVPANPDPAVRHKQYNGTNYPHDGANYGNDDYRHDRGWPYVDDKDKVKKGIVRWFDTPGGNQDNPGKRLRGKALHFQQNDSFFIRADPQCAPEDFLCCKSWNIKSDMTFCKNCAQPASNIRPHMENIQTPDPLHCPALAGN